MPSLDTNLSPATNDDGQDTPHPTSIQDQLQCPASGPLTSSSAEQVCPVSGKMAAPSTQEIDPEELRTSIETRMAYLTDFLGFRRRDQEVLTKVSPLIYESIPDLVDKLYSKLFEFDITKQVFLYRNEGFDGPLPSKVDDLTLESPQLVYRKIFMKTWARRVLTADYMNVKTFQYLDKVGLMHTGAKSFKHRLHISPLHVPYRDCALTLGWVLTVLQTAVLEIPADKLDMSVKMEAIAAINKVIWMQNDLFARHYIAES